MKRTFKTALALSATTAALLSSSIHTPAFAAGPNPPLPHPWSDQGGLVRVDPSGEIGDTPTDPPIPLSKSRSTSKAAGASGPHQIFVTNPDVGNHTPSKNASASAQICYNAGNDNAAYGYRLYLNRPSAYAWASPTYYGPKSGTCSPWKYFAGNFAGLLQEFTSPRYVWADVWLYWN